MTDNRTTEMLRKLLDECGVEYSCGLQGVTFVGDWCFVEYDNGKLAATCEHVFTPDQAIAATLIKPNVTSDQESIVRSFLRKISPDRYWDYLGEHEHAMIADLVDDIAATLGEKPRDKTEEWLLNACNQAAQDYVTQLEQERDELKAKVHDMQIVVDCVDERVKRYCELESERDVLRAKLTEQRLRAGECENVAKQPNFKCSECGASIESEDGLYGIVWLPDTEGFVDSDPNFCPNCGKAVKR